MSGCSYHLAGMCAALNAREWVFLPFGRHVCSADEQMHASGRSYHLAGVCAALARERVSFGRHVCSAERVHVRFLPFGRHVCSAGRVRVSGCSHYLAGGFAKRRACNSPNAFCWSAVAEPPRQATPK